MRETYDLKEWRGWVNVFLAIMRLRLPWRYVVYDTMGQRFYKILPRYERDLVACSLKRLWRDCCDCVHEKETSSNSCRYCFYDPSRPDWKLRTPNIKNHGRDSAQGGQNER